MDRDDVNGNDICNCPVATTAEGNSNVDTGEATGHTGRLRGTLHTRSSPRYGELYWNCIKIDYVVSYSSSGYGCPVPGLRYQSKKKITVDIYMNSQELARMHVEMAVKLTSVAHVQSLLDSYGYASASSSSSEATATATATATAQVSKSNRGRRPGAAAAESRCQWNVGSESQCKNNKKDANSYCGMHLGKIHLIDPAVNPTVF